MFNFYLYDKKKAKAEYLEHDVVKSVQLKERMRAHRDRLYENYKKRIAEIMLRTEKIPAGLNSVRNSLESEKLGKESNGHQGGKKAHDSQISLHRSSLEDTPNSSQVKLPSIKSPEIRTKVKELEMKGSKSMKNIPKVLYWSPTLKNNDKLETRYVEIVDDLGNKRKKVQRYSKIFGRKATLVGKKPVSDHKVMGIADGFMEKSE